MIIHKVFMLGLLFICFNTCLGVHHIMKLNNQAKQLKKKADELDMLKILYQNTISYARIKNIPFSEHCKTVHCINVFSRFDLRTIRSANFIEETHKINLMVSLTVAKINALN